MPEDRFTQWRPQPIELEDDDFYGLDTSESDLKRLRLTDGYDIVLAVMKIPRSHEEALTSIDTSKWIEVFDREISSHSSNYTCDAGRRLHGARVIGCK